jgi:hypothetical protein
MEPTPKISRDEYIQHMRQKLEEILGQVADAINEAPPGYIISGSEEKVRDLFADLRKQAYEKGDPDEGQCGGSRFSPLRRTQTRARPNAIRVDRTSRC